jgi:hypothetical protein
MVANPGVLPFRVVFEVPGRVAEMELGRTQSKGSRSRICIHTAMLAGDRCAHCATSADAAAAWFEADYPALLNF